MRRGASEPFVRKANDLSFRRDLYTLTDPDRERDPFSIDEFWQTIEQGLPESLDILMNCDRVGLHASRWVMQLLPFFAGLLVRHPGWESEFEARLDRVMGGTDWRELVTRDNSKEARLIELTNVAATLMAGSWNVIHFPTSVPVLASDAGYVVHHATPGDRVGYAFALGSSAVLTVLYAPDRRARPRIHWRTDLSVSRIRHFLLGPSDAKNFNATVAAYAHHEVYGPSPELLREATKGWARQRPSDLLLPAGSLARDNRETRSMRDAFLEAHRRLSAPHRTWPIIYIRPRSRFRRR